MSVRIDNWIQLHNNHLVGKITGHPDPKVGIIVGTILHKDTSITTKVVGRRGVRVITQSGTAYLLGKQHDGNIWESNEHYLSSLKEVGY